MKSLNIIIISLLWIATMTCASAQNPYVLSVKGLTFSELLNHLRAEYQLQFAYDSELEVPQLFSIQNESSNIKDLLSPIWNQAHLDSKYISDKQILLRSKKPLQDTYRYDFQLFDDRSEPLEMVAISIQELNVGTYTDMNGSATLFLKSDEDFTVDLHLLGFESTSINLSELSKNNKIALKRSNLDLAEVIIQDRITPVSYDYVEDMNVIRYDPSISSASSIAGADIMRQVQLLPGIAAHNDVSAGIKIRGGDENQTLIMMDGIPIYNASHYYGIFSSINPSYISDVSLYKNNLPIEHGGRTSGMLDLNSLKASDTPGIKGTIDLNLLTASAALLVPIHSKIDLLLGGRSSYRNVSDNGLLDLLFPDPQVERAAQNFTLISRAQILKSTPDFTFNDWNAKLSIRPNDNHQIDFNFYKSNDRSYDEYDNVFQGRRQEDVVVNKEHYVNQEDWSNLGLSLNTHSKIGNKFNWHNTAHISQYDNYALIDLSLSSVSRNDVKSFASMTEQANSVADIGFKSYATYDLSESAQLTLGVDYQEHTTDLNIIGTNNENLTFERQEEEFSSFVAYKVIFKNDWTINAGLRGSYYTGTSQSYMSPRINVSKKMDDNWTLKASAGRQYQFVRELSFESIFGRTRNMWTVADGNVIPVSSSDNFMLGARWSQNNFSLDIESYYRRTEGVVEYAFNKAPFNEDGSVNNVRDFEFYTGSGISKGIDVMLSYTTAPYTTWLSYTLSKSTNSFDRILGSREFPAQDDRRHQWKWVNEYKWKKWTINANLIYSSGRPYTDISLIDKNADRINLRPEDRIRRLPAYIRFDLGFNYDVKIGKNNMNIGLSALNLFDRDNVNYVQYIFSVPSNQIGQSRNINTVIGTETNLLNRTINLNLSFKF